MNRIRVSRRLLKPEEVRDFCGRGQNFMRGADLPGHLVVIEHATGGSAQWEWIWIDTNGEERRARRDGGPQANLLELLS